MTTAEKLTSLKAFLDITDTTQDTKLTAYLSLQKTKSLRGGMAVARAKRLPKPLIRSKTA